MAKTAKRSQLDGVARAGADEGAGGAARARSGRTRGTRAEALKIIFATAVDQGEGFRTGALGTPRFGKTFHLKEVVDEAITQGLCEIAFVHDCKRHDVQYDGDVYADVAGFAADVANRKPEDERSAIVIFHGDPSAGIKASVEDVSALGLRYGRNGGSCLVLVDELYHGLKSGRGQAWAGESFGEIMREGSSQRVSSAWTTQIPQALPREPMDCSETIAIFHLGGRSLSYVVEQLRLPPEAEPVIKRLGRGEFILWTAFDDWDGVIYGPS